MMAQSDSGSKKGKRQGMDFEVNLIPAIDLLSVCICFLLLTAVWINLGSLKLEQGVGETNAAGGKNMPSLWIEVEASGDLILSTRDLPAGTRTVERAVLTASGGMVDREKLKRALQALRSKTPTLETVIVRPKTKVPYGQVIAVIDSLKSEKVKDVGLAPET